MRRFALVIGIGILAPAHTGAQNVIVGRGADRNAGAFIREAAAQPHLVIAGTGRLDLPRDSTISTTLIVIGRDTYLASKVQGNVVVVGGDLFLRPGVDVSGHAVAIGGTVATTALGRVGGRIESYRDETYDVTATPGGYTLDYRPLIAAHTTPLIRLAGIYGVLIPSYDRVNGLSVPVGALVTLAGGAIEAEPTVTWRSRLGSFDPNIAVRINQDRPVRFEGRVGRDTRSNDKWIYGDLVNSLTSFFAGNDTRNYFRSDIVEGRLFALRRDTGRTIEPFVGARYEKTSGVTAVGNVFSVLGRKDIRKMARPNPAVASANIGSLLLGASLFDTSGVVITRLRAQAEQSVSTSGGGSKFLQLTLDGLLTFPTFRTQRLRFDMHAVTTPSGTVTGARYAYLGGSGTIPTLELLEMGGDELFYLESRYVVPVERVVLPLAGSPVITVSDYIGSAGVGGLPTLHHAIGIGVGLSVVHFNYTRDVTGRATHRNRFSFGVSLGS